MPRLCGPCCAPASVPRLPIGTARRRCITRRCRARQRSPRSCWKLVLDPTWKVGLAGHATRCVVMVSRCALLRRMDTWTWRGCCWHTAPTRTFRRTAEQGSCRWAGPSVTVPQRSPMSCARGGRDPRGEPASLTPRSGRRTVRGDNTAAGICATPTAPDRASVSSRGHRGRPFTKGCLRKWLFALGWCRVSIPHGAWLRPRLRLCRSRRPRPSRLGQSPRAGGRHGGRAR